MPLCCSAGERPRRCLKSSQRARGGWEGSPPVMAQGGSLLASTLLQLLQWGGQRLQGQQQMHKQQQQQEQRGPHSISQHLLGLQGPKAVITAAAAAAVAAPAAIAAAVAGCPPPPVPPQVAQEGGQGLGVAVESLSLPGSMRVGMRRRRRRRVGRRHLFPWAQGGRRRRREGVQKWAEEGVGAAPPPLG